MRKCIQTFLGAAVAALLFFGCNGDDNGGPDLDFCSVRVPGDIMFVEMFPFAGTLASFGPYLDPAVALAVTEINEAGGINGRSLGYIQCNTSTEATDAIAAMVELLENFEFGAIVGPVSSRCTVAIAELVKREEILLVSPVNQLPSIAQLEDDGFIFRTCAQGEVQVPVVARIVQEEGWVDTFSFHQDDAYGNGMYAIFKREHEANGGHSEHYWYLETTENYAEIAVNTAKASYPPDGPDALVNMTYVEDGAAIMRTATDWRQPNGPQWFMVNAMKHPEFIRKVGLEYVVGTMGCIVAPADDENYDRFANNFVAATDENPFDFSPNAYDAVYMVAIAMAFSSDPNNGAELRDNLAKTQSGTKVGPDQWALILDTLSEGTMDYDGASGELLFDQYGDVLQNIKEWIVDENGEFQNTRCWAPGAIPCP